MNAPVDSNMDDWGAASGVTHDDLAMDTDGYDASSGGFVDRPGTYHLAVESWEEERAKIDKTTGQPETQKIELKIKCQVMNTIQGQSPRGTIYTQRITMRDKDGSRPEWVVKQFANFYCGAGICRRVEKDGKQVLVAPGVDAAGQPTWTTKINRAVIDMIIGRQFWAPIREREYEDRTGTKKKSYDTNFAEVFPLTDPKFAHLPSGTPEELAYAGCHRVNGVIVAIPQGGMAPAAQAAPVATTAPAAQAPAGTSPAAPAAQAANVNPLADL